MPKLDIPIYGLSRSAIGSAESSSEAYSFTYFSSASEAISSFADELRANCQVGWLLSMFREQLNQADIEGVKKIRIIRLGVGK